MTNIIIDSIFKPHEIPMPTRLLGMTKSDLYLVGDQCPPTGFLFHNGDKMYLWRTGLDVNIGK